MRIQAQLNYNDYNIAFTRIDSLGSYYGGYYFIIIIYATNERVIVCVCVSVCMKFYIHVYSNKHVRIVVKTHGKNWTIIKSVAHTRTHLLQLPFILKFNQFSMATQIYLFIIFFIMNEPDFLFHLVPIESFI